MGHIFVSENVFRKNSKNYNLIHVSLSKYPLFYKQHFCKQRHAEISKKIKHMLSNTLRLNSCCYYNQKQKKKQKKKFVSKIEDKNEK